MRITDIFLSFPSLILALAITRALGIGVWETVLAIGLTWWPFYVRLVRGEVLAIKNLPYVTAARAAGVRENRILLRHVVRNLLEPIVVYFTLDIGTVLVTYSTIGFIGVASKYPGPQPEWGAMLAFYQSAGSINTYPWEVFAPGLAIFITVLAFSLLGDGLRDILDPRTRRAFVRSTASHDPPAEASSPRPGQRGTHRRHQRGPSRSGGDLVTEPILRVQNLSITYTVGAGVFQAVSDVSLDIYPRRVVGIVGETGCGKSTLAQAIPRLMPEPPASIGSGQIFFRGTDLVKIPKSKMPMVRGTGIGMIFQEPLNSLNPAYRVFDQIVEAIQIRHFREMGLVKSFQGGEVPFDYSKRPTTTVSSALTRSVLPDGVVEEKVKDRIRTRSDYRKEVLEYLRLVRINDPETIIDLFPHELSGGMRQRIMIAMALSEKPQLLIADEPTSALDVTIQAQVLTLMKDLIDEVDAGDPVHQPRPRRHRRDRGRGRRDVCGPDHRVWPRGRGVPLAPAPLHEDAARGRPADLQVGRLPPLHPGQRAQPLAPASGLPFPSAVPDRAPRLQGRPASARPGDLVRTRHPGGRPPKRVLLPGGGARTPVTDAPPLLEAVDVQKLFPLTRSLGAVVTRKAVRSVHAVDGVSISVGPGETLGLIGESGSGKTTLGWLISRIHEPSGGQIRFEGKDVTHLAGEELRLWRRNVQVVFQDPVGSLDPRLRVWQIVGEPIRAQAEMNRWSARRERKRVRARYRAALASARRENRARRRRRPPEPPVAVPAPPPLPPIPRRLTVAAVRKQVVAMLPSVGLPADCLDQYPHEFSGGGRQRISLARALIVQPNLIVLDEPTSALDVAVQAQILNRPVELQRERGIAYLLITHNVAAVRFAADRVAVMYLGQVVEYGKVREVLERPVHPYTKALLAAVPQPDPGRRKKRYRIEGDIPSLIDPKPGLPLCSPVPVRPGRLSHRGPAARAPPRGGGPGRGVHPCGRGRRHPARVVPRRRRAPTAPPGTVASTVPG